MLARRACREYKVSMVAVCYRVFPLPLIPACSSESVTKTILSRMGYNHAALDRADGRILATRDGNKTIKTR